MYVVIVGCSGAGYSLAQSLDASQHEVTVIEQDPERYELVAEHRRINALLGNGADREMLAQAGAERADVVVALTGVDATNMVICQIVQHEFQTPRTLTMVKESRNKPLFDELGIGVVVNGANLVLNALEEAIPGHPLRHLMPLRELGMELVSVSVPPDANIVGKRLSELELPPGSFISLIVKKGRADLPSSNSQVEAEDELIAVTSRQDEYSLYDKLTGV